jgi:dTDP-4-dehydrorhamnose reductase
MRILLTGGNGQVGFELRRCLAVLGEVYAPGRDVLDLGSADSIVSTVRMHRPQLIVNAAAYTAVDRAEAEPDLAMRINAEAPRILAEEAMKLGGGLIHYSTDYVFDGRAARPYREDDPTAPLNVYGRTKLAGETGVSLSGVAHLIFRTSWIYASRGRNFLLTMLKLARERKELTIVNDQFGAPTTARLVAEATAMALARIFPDGNMDAGALGDRQGIYHLTAAGRASWFEFASEILKDAAGAASVRGIPASAYPTPAARPQNSVLDNSKIQERFGLSLPDWKVGLALCLEELQVNSNR